MAALYALRKDMAALTGGDRLVSSCWFVGGGEGGRRMLLLSCCCWVACLLCISGRRWVGFGGAMRECLGDNRDDVCD